MDPFVQCFHSLAVGLDQGELGQGLTLALPSAKALLCNQSWLLPLKPPCWLITGTGRGLILSAGCGRTELLREVLEHQRISSPGRTQVTAQRHPEHITP